MWVNVDRSIQRAIQDKYYDLLLFDSLNYWNLETCDMISCILFIRTSQGIENNGRKSYKVETVPPTQFYIQNLMRIQEQLI
jgi:hypothetical protein